MKALISSDFSEAITWGDETSRLPNPFAVAYGLWKEDQQPTAEFGSWIQSVAEKTELQQVRLLPRPSVCLALQVNRMPGVYLSR